VTSTLGQKTPHGSTSPDVRDLAKEHLAEGEFPGQRPQPFRVSLDAAVHAAVWGHASENVAVEICGVLVGNWKRDAGGPFVHVCDRIRCDSAKSQAAEVTFTHDAWSQIYREMDSRFADRAIVGWYHSHPDFGIFLSDRDVFIHEHFFNSPGQIAFVVDPVRKIEGVFAWRDAKPALVPHYWVEGSIHSSPPANDAATPAVHSRSQSGTRAAATSSEGRWPFFDTLIALVCAALVFILGYLASGFLHSSERRLIFETVAAQYRNWVVQRQALALDLNTLGDQLKDAQTNLDEARNQPATAGSTDHNAKIRTATEKVEKTRQLLGKLQEVLAPSPQETAALGLTSPGSPAQPDVGKSGTTATEQKPAEKDGPAPNGSSAPPRN
jgi:proteasome lid subunit RPN8/RPN11